jgi:hypothetical protein
MYSFQSSFAGHRDSCGTQDSTIISDHAQTDSGSGPVWTAENGVHIAGQDLSQDDGQSDAMSQHPFRVLRPKPPRVQPENSQPTTYGPVNPAFILTGPDGNRYDRRGRRQGGNLILSSSSATAQTPRPPSRAPSRPATSCDLCKQQRVKCQNSDPDEQRCDNCTRRKAESCTFEKRDESNNRPKATATMDVEPPV